jgi:hypothetical protein
MRFLVGPLFALALTACATAPLTSTKSFEVSLPSSTTRLDQGATTEVTVTVDRSRGYAGEVSIEGTSAVAGVSIAPVTVPASVTTASVSVSVAADLPPGDPVPVTLTASGGGIATSALLKVVVSGFSLSVSPADVALIRGGTVSTLVTLDRFGGFSEAVKVTIGDVAPWLAAQPLTIPSGESTGQLVISAPAEAPIASGNVTVFASGTRITKKTTFGLTITVPAPIYPDLAGSYIDLNVTKEYCGADAGNAALQIDLSAAYNSGTFSGRFGDPGFVSYSQELTGRVNTEGVLTGETLGPDMYVLEATLSGDTLTGSLTTNFVVCPDNNSIGSFTLRFSATRQ